MKKPEQIAPSDKSSPPATRKRHVSVRVAGALLDQAVTVTRGRQGYATITMAIEAALTAYVESVKVTS